MTFCLYILLDMSPTKTFARTVKKFVLEVGFDVLLHSLWIQKTKLKSIKYELKIFPESWVQEKIKIRGGRKELGSPVSSPD